MRRGPVWWASFGLGLLGALTLQLLICAAFTWAVEEALGYGFRWGHAWALWAVWNLVGIANAVRK